MHGAGDHVRLHYSLLPASIPIPKFVSICGAAYDFGIDKDTSKPLLMVPLLNSKFASRLPQVCANFGFAAPAHDFEKIMLKHQRGIAPETCKAVKPMLGVLVRPIAASIRP